MGGGDKGKIHRNSRGYISLLPLEDAFPLKDPDGAAQLTLFKRLALSAIKQYTKMKGSQATKRRRAGRLEEFRNELIFG
ncbi:hypothetical protein [Xenorhabdus japonica]|uniref:hypothetical protein n=1 Tax=Xenorhabdus japonica TaxID=53341 RepID=UPI000B819AA4